MPTISPTTASHRNGPSARTRNVWVALLMAMTSVGGLLLILDGDPSPSLDGLSLVASTPNAPSIEAIYNTREPFDGARWDGVIIYDSGAMQGSAATLAADHKARHLHGLGHHFVIGNGAGQGDGELHVGYRWLMQAPGAHAAGPDQDLYNRRYIGICLIGDGDRRPFSEAQVRRLVELVRSLQQELDLPEHAVLLGRDISASTSPGRFFPENAIRSSLAGL